MRLSHREPYGFARLLDIVRDEAVRQTAHRGNPIDSPGYRQTPRRTPLGHHAPHVDGAVRLAEDEASAPPRLNLDRGAEEVLPGEVGAGERRPNLFSGGRDVDHVNGLGRE